MAEEMNHRIAHLLVHHNLTDSVAVTRSSYAVTRPVIIEVRTFHGLGFYILRCASKGQRSQVNVSSSNNLKVQSGKVLRSSFYNALKASGQLPATTERSSQSLLANMISPIDNYKGKAFDKLCENHLLHGSPLTEDEISSDMGKIQHFHLYEHCLVENDAIDYGDMIWKSVRLVLCNEQVRARLSRRYASVLVDEFQDMSASQLVLCKAIVDECKSITLVGDDDQQIYSWRTSNHWFCHRVALETFPGARTLILPENHRCTGSVVRAAQALISQNADRVEKRITAVREEGLPVRIIGCRTLELEKRFVLRSVRYLLEDTPGTAEVNVLALFRTNELLLEFQKLFKEEGIETTRDIRPRVGKNIAIGSLTLATLALVGIMSPGIDLDAFVWSVSTISQRLDEKCVHDMLAEEEQNENRSASTVVKRKAGVVGSGVQSAYLNRLMSWYGHKTQNGHDKEEDQLHAIHALLQNTDCLALRMQESGRVRDVIIEAERVLKETQTAGENSEVIAEESNEGVVSHDDNTEHAGFAVLLECADKVDRERVERDLEREEDAMRQPQRFSQLGGEDLHSDTNDEDDFVDFSALLAKDSQMSNKKRRKALGIADGIRPSGSSARRKASDVGEDLNSFCTLVRRKFGDYTEKGVKEIRKKSSKRRVQVVFSTVHKAKGSTFDHVYLCGVNRLNFPNAMMSANAMDGFGGPVTVRGEGGIDPNGMQCQEERRVFFVAQTRAAKQFTCCYSGESLDSKAHPKQSQSMFIDEVLKGVASDASNAVKEVFVLENSDIDQAISMGGAHTT